MMVVRRRQIVVLSLVLLILVAAYLQYSFRNSSSGSTTGKENGRLGEPAYVDNSGAAGSDADSVPASEKTVTNTSETKEPEKSKASATASNYFVQARLDKETVRGKDEDALRDIANDAGTDSSAKADADKQLSDLVKLSDKEMRIEVLIKEKGFEDALAMFAEDGSVDIVIKAPNLSSSQVAQISDIVSRQAGIPVSSMHIRNIY